MQRIIISLALLSLASLAAGLQSSLANIPGAQTATGIMASSVDGMSRYLAPDGPIQPALTAIGALPLRGTEMINNGITRVSSGLNNGAQSLSRSAGNDGTIRMPGMESIRQSMPTSLTNLGGMMRSAIQSKNRFIMGQAEAGVQAGDRLRSMMQNGLQSRKKRDVTDVAAEPMNQAASNVVDPMLSEQTMMMDHKMMNSMHEGMMKGGQQIKSQLQQSMNGHMSRMQSMHGMGEGLMNQAQGIKRTLSSGLSGAVEHLQRTGQQVQQQLQGGMQKNMGAMSGIVDSMHGSMGNVGQNMQKNLQDVVKSAQNAAQQVHSHIQQVASGPLSMLQNLQSSLGSMMQGKMGGSGGGGSGRGY